MAVLLLSGALPVMVATNDPPYTGGTVTGGAWVVTDTRTYSGVTINMEDNLIISSTGTLTLDDVDLYMVQPSNGSYRIEVQAGGKLYTNNGTKITSSNNFYYRFLIYPSSTAQIRNTTISKCGVMGGGTGRGIFVNSDAALFQDSTIETGYEGFHIEYASPKVLNCTIRNHLYMGVYVAGGFPTIDRCMINNNGNYGGSAAVLVEGCNSTSAVCTISNSTVKNSTCGVYFDLDSPGLLENSTVTANVLYGVMCFRSSPTIRKNNITKNPNYGMYLEESSPFIERNNITSNGDVGSLSSGIFVYMYSNPVVQENYIASNTDTGVNIRPNCEPAILRNNITLNTDKGIRFYYCGKAQVRGNNISSNYDGLFSQGSTPVISDNILWANQNDGLSADGSTILFENNSVTGTAMSGIHASAGCRILCGNSTFSGGNQHGISVDTGSSVLLVNGNFSDEYSEAFQCDAAGTLDWLVDRSAMIDGDDAVLRGNLTIMSGGRLDLSAVHMDVSSSAAYRRSLEVRSGGKLGLEGCNITAYDPAFNYKFSSLGTLEVRNSTVEEAGWSWGGDGETAGLHLGGGTALIQNSEVGRNYCGLVLRTATVRMEGSSIVGCEACAVDAKGSVLEFQNGSVTGTSQYLFRLDSSSRAELLNVNFDQSKATILDGASRLNVSWYFSVKVQWTTLEPVEGATANLSTSQGSRLYSRLTDAAGMVPEEAVMQYSQSSAQKTLFTPHTLNVTRGGLSNEGQITIDSNLQAVFTLTDPTAPELQITSPAAGSYLANRTVELTGTAFDPESDIKKVEVSWNNATWVTADTTDAFGHWNHTFILVEAAHTLRARATSMAGMTANASVAITIQVSAPFLLLAAPQDGLLTNQTNITVRGQTTTTAIVSVNVSGREYNVTNDLGDFSVRVELDEGANLIKVTAADLAGNTNVTTRRVTLDTLPPIIDLTLPYISYTNQQSIEVNGTTDGEYVTVNGQIANLTAGRFSKTIMLISGAGNTNTSIEVLARDAAGNLNRVVVYVIRDVTPPTIQVTSPARDVTLTNQSSIYVNGTVEAGANLILNGAPVATDPGGNFSLLYQLAEGTNVLELRAMDITGNLRIVRKTVQLDSTPPSLSVSSPVNGSRTNATEMDVIGTTEAGARVTVNGVEVMVGTDGSFSQKGHGLELGQNNITILAWDQAGNYNRLFLQVQRDEPPIPPLPPTPPAPVKGFLEQYLPMILILLIVVGGAGAGAWAVMGGRRDERRAAQAPRQKGPMPGQPPQGRGKPTRMMTPTEMEMARREGYRPADRPRTAEEMYGKDYARWAEKMSAPAQQQAPPPAAAAAPPAPQAAMQWEPEPATEEVEMTLQPPAANETYETQPPAYEEEPPAEEPQPEPDHAATTEKVESDIDALLKKIGDVTGPKK